MRDVPRQLTVDDLAALFEGRTRFVERLADELAAAGPDADPFNAARRVLRGLPEAEQLEALNAHPAIGAPTRSITSAIEQGQDASPEVLAELARLNREYEARFGFRFVIFVNRRPKAEVLEVLKARITRARREELATALDDLVSIAEDRHRRRRTRR
jgi:2-oxo-4-hydroxy-4-carboxy--5-ureidoimidazoline (OHCU) decarboxylase